MLRAAFNLKEEANGDRSKIERNFVASHVWSPPFDPRWRSMASLVGHCLQKVGVPLTFECTTVLQIESVKNLRNRFVRAISIAASRIMLFDFWSSITPQQKNICHGLVNFT